MIDEMRYDVFSDEHFPDDDEHRFHCTGNCESSFKARQRVSDADDFHDAGTGNFHAGDDNSNGDF